MQKSATKWAIHKHGTDQFGHLCSYRDEAEDMFADLKKDIIHMPESELKKYHVAEVTLVWDE